MTIAEKPKSKHPLAAMRRFQMRLFIWIIVMLLAAMYPPIWLVPPYHHLTPYVYIGASFLWIPFAVRHIRRFGLRWLTILLMACCVLISAAIVRDFAETNPAKGYCHWLENQPSTYLCTQGCDYINYRYEFLHPGNLPVMVLIDRYEYWNYGLSCGLF